MVLEFHSGTLNAINRIQEFQPGIEPLCSRLQSGNRLDELAGA
jgi:hypothetical protein